MNVEWESDNTYFNSWATSNLNIDLHERHHDKRNNEMHISDQKSRTCIVLDLSGMFSNVPCKSTHLSNVLLINYGSLKNQYEGTFAFLCKRRGKFFLMPF